MWLKFILMLVGAYLLGSIPAAYLGVKWIKGVDIRTLGTGNVGSSNVARTISKRLAVPIGLFDMGKGALVVWIAQLLGLSAGMQIAVGIAAIAGHNWSLFLGFRGGKGMITSLGVIAIISWKLAIIILLFAYVPAIIKQMALGVFAALIVLPVWAWFAPEWLGISIDDRLPVVGGFVCIALMGFAKRLIVKRVELSSDVPTCELLLNRLLFDRDIRNRKAWIDRAPVKASQP